MADVSIRSAPPYPIYKESYLADERPDPDLIPAPPPPPPRRYPVSEISVIAGGGGGSAVMV